MFLTNGGRRNEVILSLQVSAVARDGVEDHGELVTTWVQESLVADDLTAQKTLEFQVVDELLDVEFSGLRVNRLPRLVDDNDTVLSVSAWLWSVHEAVNKWTVGIHINLLQSIEVVWPNFYEIPVLFWCVENGTTLANILKNFVGFVSQLLVDHDGLSVKLEGRLISEKNNVPNGLVIVSVTSSVNKNTLSVHASPIIVLEPFSQDFLDLSSL